jgi:ubiquinone/menaquinone biosynthesis C-methylase UbiE
MELTEREKEVTAEFDRWAQAGRGDEMEQHHWPITRPVLDRTGFQHDDRVLDIGCGTGWLVRAIAARVPQGRVVGLDVSPQMIERARQLSSHVPNVEFQTASVSQLPWPQGSFTKVVSVESAYYWPDPPSAVREASRVLASKGSMWILINYYRDNPYCHRWGSLLPVTTHLLAAEEWAELFRQAGLVRVTTRRIPDPTPVPETYTGRWFRDAEEMRRFQIEGALFVEGGKS